MSNSKVSINNITYTKSHNSIVVGEINVLMEMPDSIKAPPLATPVHSHIILQKSDDVIFKNLMDSSPVNPFAISLYDQYGYLCNKWDEERDNNTYGNVRITSENKVLFSNIVFPIVPTDEQIYLVINSYSGSDLCCMKETKKIIIEQDIQMLKSKVDLSKIIIFIADHINKDFIDIGMDLSIVFQAVHSFPTQKLINYFCEYIAGKNVYGSKPSFQGMLNFGKNVEILVARFKQIDNSQSIDCKIRRNGRIQLNTNNLVSSIRFFVLLSHSPNKHIDITEETTESKFPTVPFSNEKIDGLTEVHFDTIFNSFNYFKKLNTFIGLETLLKYIAENSIITIMYIFKNPLNEFELILTEDKNAKMIIEYSSSLRDQIYNLYIDSIAKANVNINMNMNMNKFHSENLHFGFLPPCDQNIYPIRQSSVPYDL